MRFSARQRLRASIRVISNRRIDLLRNRRKSTSAAVTARSSWPRRPVSSHARRRLAPPTGRCSPDICKLRRLRDRDILQVRRCYPHPGEHAPRLSGGAGNQRELMAHPPTLAPGETPARLCVESRPEQGRDRRGAWTTDAEHGCGALRLAAAAPAPGVIDPGIVARGGDLAGDPRRERRDSSRDGTSRPSRAHLQRGGGEGRRRRHVQIPHHQAAAEDRREGQPGRAEVDARERRRRLRQQRSRARRRDRPRSPRCRAAPVVTDPTPGLAPAAQQLWSTVAQASARPLSWTSDPYGSNAGLQRIRQGGGTTLNNTGYG